jgi:hypothetical protein
LYFSISEGYFAALIDLDEEAEPATVELEASVSARAVSCAM